MLIRYTGEARSAELSGGVFGEADQEQRSQARAEGGAGVGTHGGFLGLRVLGAGAW